MVADIQSMRQMTSVAFGDPETHWHQRFRSLPASFHRVNMGHVMCSLRVAVAFIIIAVISAVVALFFPLLVWLFPRTHRWR
jgi:hypothetical protein